MNVYIEKTGCTRRKLDVTKLQAYFEMNGYRVASDPEGADYILVSTCALKSEEEDNSLQLLDSYRECRGKVLVYGCLPVIAPTRYKSNFDFDFISPAEINNVDLYFRHITHRFAEMADANVIQGAGEDTDGPAALRYVRNKYLGKRPVYHLFVSRGCLGRCSYCAARFAIGPLQSKPVEVVVEEFNRGVEAGYRDFIIIGDDVGAYGIDRGEDFPRLFASLLAETGRNRPGPASNAKNTITLHIDEFHPRWVVRYRREMAGLLESRNVASLVCPIQSGSDRVLDLMQRDHDMDSALSALGDLHAANRTMKINSKVMVGFPSERESDFAETLDKVGNLPLSAVTIISYEEKENTPACSIQPKIPAPVVEERVRAAQTFFRKNGIKSIVSCCGL